MKALFQPGDKKTFERRVGAEDTANFTEQAHMEGGGHIHPVYSTYALARDAEWACRLFVLEMKEAGEEGIGTMVTVKHLSPALIGSNVKFEATVKSIRGNEIICSWTAEVDRRAIATGEQGQKILRKESLAKLFKNLEA